ncbi:peptidoglycan editing factor PgeF [Laribacter hongkongensis]|uniref:Purine nucleoside phosphorylase n=1 Tax=Laribacter hongkongensis TaxID=168471 RepID=A0ABD4SNS1_9NEIS|nr:peptidoglycan editing factor PgeF [Laribacter hongkongensis]MCG9024768.1 peptidoglycan editing factor PgeF [Laribacter hongkongensis]MCG9100805.1 peptidoglycan editing factor PgeF [Laribacter hongkongensis]MCG9102179.1 peptidoglycan editing factor PgeF [Laribacter hongkongensis]MCG9112213.1 peptidoglycan editing factor PgeF [Laribacter hongkongensis]MCG9118827.1 peptidoglycan editing factor PgeF [Laribacter hongkongensis]
MQNLTAGWPAPARVRTLVTTRDGGVSLAPYASLNLGQHVGDDPAAVAENRARLRACLPAEPFWLNQVHGIGVQEACADAPDVPPDADAGFTRQPGVVCAVMTADCLPVLLTDRSGCVVAAAHAGWRGLCNGIIEATIVRMAVPANDILAWLGPAIGPDAFEVGPEVRTAFMAHDPTAASAFAAIPDGKYLADIYLLARQRLNACGVTEVHGGDACTVTERERYFSYRRDGRTGRMASLIWLAD